MPTSVATAAQKRHRRKKASASGVAAAKGRKIFRGKNGGKYFLSGPRRNKNYI